MTKDPHLTVKIWPILAIALVLRLGILAIIWVSTAQLDNPLQSNAFNGGDSDQYIQLAENMVEHGAFSLQTSEPFTPNMRRTPGYPAVLALLYILAGHQHDPVLIIIVQTVLSVLNVWLVIRLGTKLFSTRIGWVAGWLYAFAPATLVFTGLVMSETLFATLLLAGTLLCIELFHSEGNKVLQAGLAGLVFAFLAYTRPIALYYVPIPLLALLIKLKWSRRGLALGGIMLLAFVAALTPWFYRNYVHFNTLIFTNIGNQNLLFYNISSIEAQRQGIKWEKAKQQISEEYNQRLAENYDSPTAADRSKIAGEIVVEHIMRHPVETVLYQTLDMVNILRPGYSMTTLILRSDGQTIGSEVQDGNLGVLLDGKAYEIISYVILTIYYLILYVILFWGTITLFLRRNWINLILLGMTAFYFLYLPGSAGNSRFRAPLEGYLTVIGAVGLTGIAQHKWVRFLESLVWSADKPIYVETEAQE